jgi:ArsR family transcriptional regulator, lead/cadmium/zinc/bismuth-responsive transcriptional repressor
MNVSSNEQARRRPRARRGGVPIADPARSDRIARALGDHAQVERLSRTFRALGDPTRSKLVYALSLDELCVGELAAALGASMSAVSHQLRILRDLDIVRVRRDGRSQLYALNERAFGFCSPRSCQAWRTTVTRPPLLPAESLRARGPRGRR